MNNWILLAVSMAFCLGGDILRKWFTERHGEAQWKIFTCNTVCSLVACLVLLLWGGIGSVSLFTALLGVLFGTVTALQAITTMKALQAGPMSYTTVIISCSTILSALSGFLFFGESIAWVQYLGIALMLISFFLAIEKSKENKGTSLRWLAYCLLAFCLAGSIGIMQKIESLHHADELNAFLVIAFAVSSVFSAFMALLLRSRAAKQADTAGNKPLFDKTGWKALLIPGCMALLGVSAGVNNKLNLDLVGKFDTAVFFPIVNGGGLVLASLAAILLFRERLSVKRWIGVIVGIASVVLLCNPFG